MVRRIIYGLVALVALFLCYDIYQVYTARGKIDKAEPQYVYGPEDADLTVVEFLDYACPYCREAHPTIMDAVNQDGRVRYIPRVLPTQNSDSINAFILAHKAGQYGKFFEMHDVLMRQFRPLDERSLPEMAFDAGLDLEKVDAEFDVDAMQERLAENQRLFELYGGKATPMFIIGDRIYVPEGRMPTVQDFLRMFGEERSK